MGCPLRGHVLDTAISQRSQVNSLEESLSSTQQDRRDRDVQLINEAGTEVLLYGVGPTAKAYIHSVGCLARPLQRFVNAARHEMERGIASISMGGRA